MGKLDFHEKREKRIEHTSKTRQSWKVKTPPRFRDISYGVSRLVGHHLRKA